MKTKIVLLGVVLAAFLMLMMPCISAVNVQVKETIFEQKLENRIQDIDQLKIGIFLTRIFGLAYAGLGAFVVVSIILDPTTYLGTFAICSAAMSLMYAVMKFFGGADFLDSIVVDFTTSFALYLAIGFAAIRMGLYMFRTGEMIDETFRLPLIDLLDRILSRGLPDLTS